MFCGYCGKQIPDTVKYCPYCGEKTLLSSNSDISAFQKKYAVEDNNDISLEFADYTINRSDECEQKPITENHHLDANNENAKNASSSTDGFLETLFGKDIATKIIDCFTPLEIDPYSEENKNSES